MLEGNAGAVIVGLNATVDARAKGDLRGTLKRVRAVGFVGADYGKAVVREGARQYVDASEFTPARLPWGQWLVPHKVITHKGAYYLRTQSTPGQRRAQPAKVLGYMTEDMEPMPASMVRPYLPAPSYSARQQEVGVGDGTPDEQVWVRTYAFSSIDTVRVGGCTYKLVP